MLKHQEAKKLESPLYCSQWIGRYCLVAGGGGRESTGLPNRLWCIEETSGILGNIISEFGIKEDAPLRMAIPDDGSFALLAMGFGGLVRVEIDLKASPPALHEYTGVHCQRLKTVGEVNCLCLSKNMRRLAIGIRDGPVQILEWPDLQLKTSLSRGGGKASSRAPRDVAFSNSHGNRVVAVIYDDGSCGLWDIYLRLELSVLDLPAEMKGGNISRVVFTPTPSSIFYTAVNAHRKGYLVRWKQDRRGKVYAEASQKVHDTAVTALAVSSSGTYLGTGTSDGDIAIFFAANFALVNSVRQGHMVFCTSVAFSSEEKGLLSVSGDASMRTLLMKSTRRSRTRTLLLLFPIFVLAALIQLLLRLWM